MPYKLFRFACIVVICTAAIFFYFRMVDSVSAYRL